MVKKKLNLKKKALDSVEAVFKDSEGVEVKKEVGTHPSNLDKIEPHTDAQVGIITPRTVGVSKGVTLNMGDFQSLRVDVWLSDNVEEGEEIKDAFVRVNDILDEQLKIAVEKTEKSI